MLVSSSYERNTEYIARKRERERERERESLGNRDGGREAGRECFLPKGASSRKHRFLPEIGKHVF
jgi:hypothetical protein